jgi:hypothetical protein
MLGFNFLVHFSLESSIAEKKKMKGDTNYVLG